MNAEDTPTPTPDAAPAPPDAPPEHPGPVPHRRFAEQVAKANEATTALTAAQARIAELEPASASFAELTTKYDTESTAWASERALYQAGLSDPDAHAVARLFHEQAGEGAPAIGDWVATQRANIEAAPRGLRPYLAGPAPVVAPAVAPVVAPPTKPLPTSGQHVAPNDTTSVSAFTNEQIAAMSTDEYKVHRDVIMAQQPKRR